MGIFIDIDEGEIEELERELSNYSSSPGDFSRLYSMFFEEKYGKPRKKDILWLTKKGEVLPLRAMDTNHLINCRNKIIREGWRPSALPYLEAELKIRNKKQKRIKLWTNLKQFLKATTTK